MSNCPNCGCELNVALLSSARRRKLTDMIIGFAVGVFGWIILCFLYSSFARADVIDLTAPNPVMAVGPSVTQDTAISTHSGAPENLLVVSIFKDGGSISFVTFRPGFSADDKTARKLWELLAQQYPLVCKHD